MPAFGMLTHPVAHRQTAGDPRVYQRPVDTPTHDGELAPAPYFPEGGVAAPPFMIVNPVSTSPGSFPGNGTQNQLVGQVAASWIRVRDSAFQGQGVDPNRKWPRQFHSERYNFNSLDMMPFPDQIGPIYLSNLNRPEKAGWSVPKYAEQYEQQTAQFSINDLMQTRDPASLAFAIGWGYVG